MPDFEIGRGQRGLPVVDVDHVGREAHVAAELQAGTGQKGKAARVVQIVVEIGVVVEAVALEVVVISR